MSEEDYEWIKNITVRELIEKLRHGKSKKKFCEACKNRLLTEEKGIMWDSYNLCVECFEKIEKYDKLKEKLERLPEDLQPFLPGKLKTEAR